MYEKFRDIIQKEAIIAIKGRFTIRDGSAPSINAENIELMDNRDPEEQPIIQEDIEEVEVKKPRRLWLKYNLNDGIIHDAVKKILSAYNGIDEVFVKDTATNKAYKINSLITIRESLIYELETILDKSCILIQE